MAQNLKAAMAMEKVYRKLQDNWQAKTAFGYHDKLKQFGFADPWTGTIGKLSEMYPKSVIRYGSYRRQA